MTLGPLTPRGWVSRAGGQTLTRRQKRASWVPSIALALGGLRCGPDSAVLYTDSGWLGLDSGTTTATLTTTAPTEDSSTCTPSKEICDGVE